jgi:hypothetical protein
VTDQPHCLLGPSERAPQTPSRPTVTGGVVPYGRFGTSAADVLNYGPEFVAKEVREWITAVRAKTAYIEPGSLRENGCCESFNSRLRNELLTGEIFYTLKEA